MSGFLRHGCLGAAWWGLLLLLAAAPAAHAQTGRAEQARVQAAQTLAEEYRARRFLKQAERLIGAGGRAIVPRAPEHVPAPSDSIWHWLLSFRPPPEAEPEAAPQAPVVHIDSWRLYRKLERHLFEKKYGETLWAYAGSNRRAPLDTMWTRELRARMEARFGAPTQTLNEIDVTADLPRDEYIQFEYWFVLNDSIPLVVMDVNGPFERGLVVASDHRYRDILQGIKDAFLQEVTGSNPLGAFVDYYYHVEQRAWYRTGYDGAAFFLQRIGRPNLTRGRPVLRDPNG